MINGIDGTPPPSDGMASLKECCQAGRATMEKMKAYVWGLQFHRDIDYSDNTTCLPAEAREAFENLRLAYRHLEDARMRLGKAIQAIDGGVSCYPK